MDIWWRIRGVFCSLSQVEIVIMFIAKLMRRPIDLQRQRLYILVIKYGEILPQIVSMILFWCSVQFYHCDYCVEVLYSVCDLFHQ
jgi:hypothetical protein